MGGRRSQLPIELRPGRRKPLVLGAVDVQHVLVVLEHVVEPRGAFQLRDLGEQILTCTRSRDPSETSFCA